MSDNITINTTTENINLSVSTSTDVYSLSVINVDGASRWGLIVGTLSAQTDLWNALSAIQYSDGLPVLSASVSDIITFLNTTSGSWNGGFDAFTTVSTNSAYWNSAHSWVQINSANATFQTISAISLSGVFYGDGSNLIGASLPGQADINTIVQSSSANWNTAYDTALTYQTVSSSYATNTLLQSTSALLTPLTTTNTLTSQLVTNATFNHYQTSVAASTATLLPTSIYRGASGNWQSTFDIVNTLSGNWNNVYNNVHSNSATWVGGHEAYTNLVANSAAYLATPVYGTVEQIVATPGSNNSVTLSLPNSIVTPGDLNVTGSLFVNGTAANINSINISLSDSILYLAEGNISNVVDIGFVGNFTPAPSSYQHTGLVRVARDNKWTLFSGVTAEPTTVVDFSSGYNIDTLRANIEGTLVGNVSGDISGNAGSVTNGVYTNQSYSDPSWITSLADTKITGANRDSWDSVYSSWNSASATSVVEFNDTRFSKLSSQAYTLVDATNSIQPIRGGNVASGNYSVVAGGGSKVAYNTLLNNLLAYWKLDDNGSSGLSLVDSTNNGYTLINNNGVALGTGKINGGASFGGNSLETGTLFPFSATNELTISFWFNYSNTGYQGFICDRTYAGWFFIAVNDGFFRAYVDSGNVQIITPSLAGTGWNHAVMVANSEGMELYINGNLAGSSQGSITFPDNDIMIGNVPSEDAPLDGLVDEVGVWNRALTPLEVSTLFNSNAGLSYPFGELIPANTASGDYSFIAGGSNNDTNNQENTFILGSNITASQPNYTYVNNLSTSGSLVTGSLSARNNIQTDGQIALGNYTLVNNAPVLYGGNVGFGITSAPDTYIFRSSPAGEVTFSGPIAFFGFADRGEYNNSTKDGGFYKLNGVISFWNNTLNQNTVSIADNGNVAIGVNGYGTYNSDGITSNMPYAFNVAGESKFANNVYVDGNVGIGTTTPLRKYHQEGGKFLVHSNEGSYGQFQLTNPDEGEVSVVFGAGATINNDGTFTTTDPYKTWAFGAGTHGVDPTKFTIGNNGAGGIIFTIDSSTGNVGIGTTTPTTKLDVNGVITATGGNSNNWNSTFTTVQANSAVWGTGGGGGGTYFIVSADFNAIVNRQYLVDTTTSSIVGTLPLSPAIGDNISFTDLNNTWGSRPLILNNNGNLLETYNEPLTANISGYQFKIIYIGGSYGWKIA